MATYFHVIFFSLAGGVFSLIGGLLLLSRKNTAQALAKYATPFAAGALIAAVFLDLLKEGIREAEPEPVLIATVVGILIFFFAERALHWFHHHHQHKGAPDPTTGLIIAGDTLHNAIDGVAIAAAFLVSIPTGIVTTLAVAAHEIPQEIGDFGLLLHKGMKRRKVLAANVLSALATTLAAIVTFALGSADKLPFGALLGLSAGFLLYIAMSDIIPELHENSSKKRLFDWQPLMLLLGVIVVGLAINVAHGYIEVDEDHGHTHNQTEAPHKESDHGHEVLVISDHEKLPSLKITLKKDTKRGYNLFVQTSRFEFAPHEAGGKHVEGYGHAHIYVNDVKIGRLYGDSRYIEELKVGDKLRISLNSNDHRDIVHDGMPVAAELTVLDMDEQSVADPFYYASDH